MFFYSDTQPRSDFSGNVWGMNGTKCYLTHYDNLLFLKFVTMNPKATFAEKAQAEKELKLCEKKLEFWRRHPKYVHESALNGCIELKKKWGVDAPLPTA